MFCLKNSNLIGGLISKISYQIALRRWSALPSGNLISVSLTQGNTSTCIVLFGLNTLRVPFPLIPLIAPDPQNAALVFI